MMYSLDLVVLLSFLGLLAWAAVSDGIRFVIPNRVCAAIVLLYPVHVLVSPEPVAWLPALAVGVAVMGLGTLAFSLGWMGGGDVKLFAASSLWAGPAQFSTFILVTSVAGGILALGGVLLWLLEKRGVTVRGGRGDAGEAVLSRPVLPYGIAIAAGGAFIAVQMLRG